MRKGISLIELIFTIVIIAVVFTVIPKIILALNKSDEFSIKQDALFNGVTMMQMISRLSWDENSVESNNILSVTSGNSRFTCSDDNTSIYYHYRVGGFKGSRNCEEHNNTLMASTISNDSAIHTYDFNDIDDFDNNGTLAKVNDESKYGLHVKVKYISDTDNTVLTYNGQNATIDLNKSIELTGVTTSNLKKVHIDINTSYSGNKKNLQQKQISQFDYISANIGKTFLAKRTW